MKRLHNTMTGTVSCPYCGEVLLDFAIPLDMTIGAPLPGSPGDRHVSVEVSMDARKVERECERIERNFALKFAHHVMTCKAVDVAGEGDMEWWGRIHATV